MERHVISIGQNDNISYNHTSNTDLDQSAFTPHMHDRCEIIYLVRGDMSYIAEGRAYELKAGDVVISRPAVLHNIFPKQETVYERYDIIVDHKCLPSELWQRIRSGRDVYKCAGNDLIYDLFSRLDHYCGRFNETDYAHLLFNITQEVLYNLSLMEGEDEVTVNPIIDKALSYIRENLTEIKGIEEICDALYITKGHLHHLFIKHMNMTPLKYITSKRLALARKKIRRGGKPTAIFTECGFNDYATFFRNYKAYYGYPPAEEGTRPALRDTLF